MSGLMIGSAVLGGLAGWGGAALSAKKKTTAQPVIGPYDTEEGKLYKKTIADRMAGIGVGYPSDYLSYNAPYAQSRKENVANYEIPAISASASARGLGRSTIPVNQSGLANQQASRDIEQRIAEMSLKNEAQKRAEINAAIGDYGNIALNTSAGENAKYKSAWDTENINRDIAQANKTNMYGSIASGVLGGVGGAGSGSATGLLSGLVNSGVGGINGNTGSSGGTSLKDYESILNELYGNAALVNRSGGNTGKLYNTWWNQ